MGLTFYLRPGVTEIKLTISGAVYSPVQPPPPPAPAAPPPAVTSALNELLQINETTTPAINPAPAEGTPAERSHGNERPQWKREGFEKVIIVNLTSLGEQPSSPFHDRSDNAKNLVLDVRVANPTRMDVRPVTVSLINKCALSDAEFRERDAYTIFQAHIRVESVEGTHAIFAESPGSRCRRTQDEDYAQHALLYRHKRVFAAGHGCAVKWGRDERASSARQVETDFVPESTVLELKYDVLKDSASQEVLTMKFLAGEREDAWILLALENFCCAYSAWLDQRTTEVAQAVSEIGDPDLRDVARTDAAEPNMLRGREVLARMRGGIETLRSDAVVFRCFRLANEAMHRQSVMARFQRTDNTEGSASRISTSEPPTWRPFQLAFLLLSINSIARPAHCLAGTPVRERDLMDLIWFPTGGGKTEAYLGLSAFTLFYRRLRYALNPDQGAGVAVLTRYTLRLLTTQQFERSTRLICACEVLRAGKCDMRGAPLDLGKEPFKIGLWIGGNSTPNRFDDVGANADRIDGAWSIARKLRDNIQLDPGPDLRQLRTCPWCGTELNARNIRVVDDRGATITRSAELQRTRGHRLILRCEGRLPGEPRNIQCPFSKEEGLPVQLVDAESYVYPPSMIIGTVDKFARLAWSSDTRALFGRGSVHYPPPELIIQDELHLISGPLGTLVGLFEGAIDCLCSLDGVRPKVIGSTATIRRASEQVRQLYDREVRQFPPPELTVGESFFSQVDLNKPGRIYLGVMTPGFSGKHSWMRCCGMLAQLAQELPEADRDPYWTQLCYFNSTREMAGSKVVAQDWVPNFIQSFKRIREGFGFSAPVRELAMPEEMTSRLGAGDVPRILERLKARYDGTTGSAIDILVATNMISVGVDVDRLGLMLIFGQPKTTAEYIQASSRVGRQKPGLVLTLYNWGRSRDRSHYERFTDYHDALYREVEATSVTPWAAPTRERMLPALLITLFRHLDDELALNPRKFATLSLADWDALVRPVMDRARSQDPS